MVQERVVSEIPKQPDNGNYNDHEWYAHEHAVAVAAVEQVKTQQCLCSVDYVCSRCKTLKRIEDSGWTP